MLSEYLRTRRQAVRKSQDALAYESDLSRSLIQGLESGRIVDMRLSVAVKLARSLNVKVEEIFALSIRAMERKNGAGGREVTD